MAKRTENFSSEEKLVFSEIVKCHDIVECKAYNSDTIQKKKIAWQKITEAFNSSFPHNSPRDTKTLLGLWRRLKLQAKSSLELKRKKTKTTGGGPPPSPISNVDENVLAVLGDSVDPIENPYDDEGEFAQIPAEGVTVQLSVISERELNRGTEVTEVEKEKGKEKEVIESTMGSCSSQTPSVKSRKRRHVEDEEDEVAMMKEIHQKQLRILELQERKALLDIYLVEQEIKKKGYDLPEWHNSIDS